MRPLADLRIVAVEQYGAGPFGSVHLAELGADVIKLEDPRSGGDVGRAVPPYQQGTASLFFETFNHDKRSVALDLAHPSGRAVFHDLVRRSDAVYSNLRGDMPERGITYLTKVAHRPILGLWTRRSSRSPRRCCKPFGSSPTPRWRTTSSSRFGSRTA